MRSIAFALACVALGATPALAKPKKVLITPIEGASRSHPQLPERITGALEATARTARAQHSRGGVGLDELLLMVGCDIAKPACRKRLLSTVGAKQIIGGAVFEKDGAVSVTITRIDDKGGLRTDTHTLAGGTDDELVASFEPAARQIFGLPALEPAPEPEPEPGPAPAPEPEPDLAPAPDPMPDDAAPAPDPMPDFAPAPETGADTGGPRLWTYGLAGAGAALLAGGVVTLVLANGAQDDVDRAPTATEAELDALTELESTARFRYRLGYALLGAGAIAAATGVTLVLLQRRDRRSPAVSIAPTRSGVAASIGGVF